MANFFETEVGGTLRVNLPFDATGKTVVFMMHPPGNAAVKTWTPATITSTYVQYTIAAGDLPAGSAGTWRGVVKVTATDYVRLAQFRFLVDAS